MYFCPNCSYSFDINKSTKISKDVDNRKVINKVTDLLTKITKKEDLSEYRATFDKEELLINKKYLKISEEQKEVINRLFEENTVSGAEFKCNNCNFTNQITETILLYQINTDQSSNKSDQKSFKMKTLEENEFMAKDPLLPHTHDYTCKNPGCITHKNKKLKDAIFYKEKNTFKVNYICCVCFYGW